MRNPGRSFPAEENLPQCVAAEAFAVETTVMVHIAPIREKNGMNPKEPEYLKVVGH